MSRHLLTLSPSNRALAVQGVQRAPAGWVLELRAPKRTDDQNRALWGLLAQIQKQRPTHNGVPMTQELWKATFMDALNSECTIMPKLDGKGYFPMHSTSRLTKTQFADLLTLMIAWATGEGLTITHFDEPSTAGGGAAEKAAPELSDA